MTNRTADTSLDKTARIAGFLFLFTFLGPLFYGAFVFPKITAAGNVLATADSMIANQMLFRFGILNEIICSAGAVVFALVLYILLKPVNKNLALLALFFKLIEASLSAVNAFGHFLALLMLTGGASLTAVKPEQVHALVGSYINLYFNAGAFIMVFHGLNSMLFLYLLFKSRFVPGLVSGFGILSYGLIFMYALMAILAPHSITVLAIQIVFLTPSVLSELLIGSWLLWKGAKTSP